MENNLEAIITARRSAARRLFGHALQHSPEAIFIAADNPIPVHLAERVTDCVIDELDKTERERTSLAEPLLFYGILDTQIILEPYIIASIFKGDRDGAMAIAHHPKTIHTVGLLALRSEDLMQSMIDRNFDLKNKIYDISDNGQYLEVKEPSLSPQPGGCPFAGSEETINIDPLFRRFVGWTGELCVRSLHHLYK